jgi:hypothetical protein
MSNNYPFPSLDDLSVFLAVSRGRGFRTAARWLRVSPSTVSETISRLMEAGAMPVRGTGIDSLMVSDGVLHYIAAAIFAAADLRGAIAESW